jgi:hypothetical protein
VDAATGASLGSRIIERDSTETFQLLDETAQEVAGFLRRAMDTAVRVRRYDAGTESVEAWHLLMAARDLRHTVPGLLRQRRFEEAAGALDRSDATLRSASALDPEWAEPFVERAENAIWRSGAALLAPSTFSEVGWAAFAYTAASSALDLV